MDHFVELAKMDGIAEAIALITEQAREGDPWQAHDSHAAASTFAGQAADLKRYDFLRREHQSAWIVQVVHAFYNDPKFAAHVWKNLRYGADFRNRLADFVLEHYSRPKWFQDLNLKDETKPIPKELELYRTAPKGAVDKYVERLKSGPEWVDELCRATHLIPEPPAFIRALLDAADRRPEECDGRAATLLAVAVGETVTEAQKEVTDPEVRSRVENIAVPFNIVLHGELDQIQTTRNAVHRAHGRQRGGATDSNAAPLRRALDMNLLGLAFSGGGIRSATFNLGVLQALSKVGLLRHFDYLSTVSGGGYIGSWLAAWIRREADARSNDTAGEAMRDIERRLAPTRSPNPMDEQVRPIRFLREYSNYLTPRTGFFSADTWTMLGIFLRNALLNQVIIVTLFSAALLGPRLAVSLTWLGAPAVWVPWTLWLLGGVVLVVNLYQLRPPGDKTRRPLRPASEARSFLAWVRSLLATPSAIQLGVVLPWALAIASACAYFRMRYGVHLFDADTRWNVALLAGLTALVTFGLVLAAGRVDRCWATSGRSYPVAKAIAVTTLASIVSGGVASGLTWVVLRLLAVIVESGPSSDRIDALLWHSIGLGTAGILSVVSLSIVAMLGMLGETFPDEHREWWSKLRTFIHVWAIGWLLGFVAAVYVPWGAHWLRVKTDYSLETGVTALAGWIASTWFGVNKGRTAEEDTKKEHESGGAAPGWSAAAMRFAAQAAPYIFIIGLVIALSVAIDVVFQVNAPATVRTWYTGGNYWTFATWTTLGDPSWIPGYAASAATPVTAIAFGALLILGLLFSWRVDINDFSLHHFYKNRLVRCYLGASHQRDRHADWFTGFDPDDDVRLQRFAHDPEPDATKKSRADYPGPYPILNCALNLVAGDDLAWQERKSTSFVFTPKYCGYDVDRAVLTRSHHVPTADLLAHPPAWRKFVDRVDDRLFGKGLREDAYVPTSAYYRPGEGPLLGMAMAISGAAANPNMGRASSPALAFLMTVFNVRLGWWVGNPRETRGVTKPSPRLGLPYTFLELFGGADDRKKYVNLSDGGHFENLGVYELVRRGCRYIVACDAGQDGRFLAEDLGTLVRQCRTDFGVEIDIDIDRIRQRSAEGLSQTHCVVGKIRYLNIPRRDRSGRLMNEDEGPLVAGSQPAHEEGYLVYLKPSITGNEAQDLLEYFRRIPEFPHQTTADQWFDESQFESYRKLGMHIGEETFSRYQDDDTKPVGNIHLLFERLASYWHPPSTAIDAHSTAHVLEYARIMDLIRTKYGLRQLDHTLFDEWTDIDGQMDPRDEFYICNALIQLMENVYADLDLEHQWDHPHVEGWMNVFTHWAQQPPFRRTWRISEWTYAGRFRNFYKDRLQGRAIALPRSFIASHRGNGTGHRENTVEAFLAAIEQGASVIEIDVRTLADKTLVLCHDAESGGVSLSKITLEQMRLRPRDQQLTTLADCARALHGKVQLNIELKEEHLVKAVLDVLRPEDQPRDRQWRRRDFVLTSFKESMIAAAHQCDFRVRTGLLIQHEADFDRAVKNFIDLRTDFLAPAHTLVDSYTSSTASADERLNALKARKRIKAAVEQGVPLVPYSDSDSLVDTQQRTAKEARLAKLLENDAIAGIITDDIRQAVEVKNNL